MQRLKGKYLQQKKKKCALKEIGWPTHVLGNLGQEYAEFVHTSMYISDCAL
jgi:hypothetical protein